MPGVIIRIDSAQFLKKFIYEELVSEFYYVVVSDVIKIADPNSRATSRISMLSSLAPTTDLRALLCNTNMTQFCNEYMRYLASPEIFPSIVTLVKAYLTGLDIVLINSDDEENDTKCLQLIGDYIKNIFDIDVYSYEYYYNHKKECRKTPDNLDDIIKVYEGAVEWTKTHRSEKQIKTQETKTKEELNEELKEMSSKELKKICKELDIVYDSSINKKELRKLIIKKVIKRMRSGMIIEK